MNGGVEALSVSVQQKANKWLDLVNIYVPPKARDNDIRWIPVKDTTIIAGDLNGHHQLWDRAQPNGREAGGLHCRPQPGML